MGATTFPFPHLGHEGNGNPQGLCLLDSVYSSLASVLIQQKDGGRVGSMCDRGRQRC